MKRHKKIIIPLNADSNDPSLVSWASLISNLSDVEEVHFLHYIPKEDWKLMPSSAEPWSEERVDSELKEKLNDTVTAHWTGPASTEINLHILEDKNILHLMLTTIADIEADLVILNRESMGINLATRLIRKSTCSVLMLPESCDVAISKIIVPTDFSLHSLYATEIATAFAKALDLKTLYSYHSFNIGERSHKAMIPESELLKMSKNYATEEHERFYADYHEPGIKIDKHNAFSHKASYGVSNYAESIMADLIILSCRGSNSISEWLLGTIPENLLKESKVPVMAVKTKGTGANLLRTFLKSDGVPSTEPSAHPETKP